MKRSMNSILGTTLVLLAVLAFPFRVTFAAMGDPDTSFGNGGVATYPTAPLAVTVTTGGGYGMCCQIVQQADGKTIVIGALDGDRILWIVRLNTDGSVDSGYGYNGLAVRSFGTASQFVNGVPLSAQIDRYGRLLVAGYATNPLSNDRYIAVWRIDPNGIFDTTFGGSGGVILTERASQAVSIVAHEEKVYVLREFPDANGNYVGDTSVYALNNDGTISITFGGLGLGNVKVPKAHDLAVQPGSNKVLVATESEVRRFSLQGTLDSTFGNQGIAKICNPYENSFALVRMATQPDGKIVVAKSRMLYFAGNFIYSLTRLTNRGRNDAGFGANGCVQDTPPYSPPTYLLGYTKRVRIQADGKIVVQGSVRFNPDGSFDTQFPIWPRVEDFWLQRSDGKIVTLKSNSPTPISPRDSYIVERFLP